MTVPQAARPAEETLSSPTSVPPPRRSPADRPGVATVVLAVAAVVLFAALFAPRVLGLAHVWSVDDNYSHGFLVPFVCAYLAWEILRRQGLSTDGSVGGGLLWLGIGIAFHLWGMVFDWAPIDFVALATMLYGLAVLLGGRIWAGGFAFPILFLFFLFPLPPVVTDNTALWLQGVVSGLATEVMRLFTAVAKNGSTLTVSGHRLEVGEACSGLRQLIAFVALSLLVAHKSDRGAVVKTALVLSALPVAIAANLLRVLLMAFITVRFGPEWISEHKMLPAVGISLHTAWGLLTMIAGLGLFLAVRWWLYRAFPAAPVEVPAGGKEPEANPSFWEELRALTGRADWRRPLTLAVVVLAVALALQLALQTHLRAASDAAVVGLTQRLDTMPASLGPWSVAREATLDPTTLRYFTQADDGLNRIYEVTADAAGPDLPAGLECRVFMVHFKDGSDRRHHPRICYKVQGFVEDANRNVELEMPGHPGKAARFCFTRGDVRSYVYYWHYTLEPTGTEKLSPLQAVHLDVGVRRPSLTVQVYTNAQAEEHLAKAAEFVRSVDRQLQSHLPPGARRGSEVMAVKFVQ